MMWAILSRGICVLLVVVMIEAEQTESGNVLTRIFGGQTVTDIENYPYQISMRVVYPSGQTAHFCGGSIISKQHIVTAAHCVQKRQDPASMRAIRVFTGSNRSDQGKAHRVRSIKVHPGYTGDNDAFNDIAVVTLSDPIHFDSKQSPISPPTRDVVNGATAIITGWGDTSPNSNTPIYLQKATMRLITKSQCERIMPYNLRNTQVCARSGPGVGVCFGDSGGPLVVNKQLVGIASYVAECGEGYPDVYTNVYPYLNFIKQIVKSEDYTVQENNPFEEEYLKPQGSPFDEEYVKPPGAPSDDEYFTLEEVPSDEYFTLEFSDEYKKL